MYEMNKKTIMLLLSVILIMSSLNAQTAEDEKIKEIIELSNMARAFDQLSNLWDSKLENINMDLESKNKFKSILYKVFDKDSLTLSYSRNYKKRYIKEKGDSLLMLYHTPLFQKFLGAQAANQTEEAQQLIIEFVKNCNLEDTSDARLKFCYRLERSLDAGNLILSLSTNYLKSFLFAVNPFLTENERMSKEQIDMVLAKFKEQMSGNYKKMIIIGYLFTYRDMPLDEFEKFIEFYDSEIGRWSINIAMAAINDVFREVAVKMAIEIKILLPNNNIEETLEF